MPTGSGKTIGAIWGIIELLEKAPTARLCFLTPYIEAVEDIYQKVSQHLGPEIVGRYHVLVLRANLLPTKASRHSYPSVFEL